MIVLLVLGLIGLTVMVNRQSRSGYASGPPPGWEPPEEREARLRTEALIASYPARHRAFMEAQRPTALAFKPETREVRLCWPDGREEWTTQIDIDAKRIRPKGMVYL